MSTAVDPEIVLAATPMQPVAFVSDASTFSASLLLTVTRQNCRWFRAARQPDVQAPRHAWTRCVCKRRHRVPCISHRDWLVTGQDFR